MDALAVVGLTRTEAKLYAVLVDLGRAQAGMLSRRTGIHRRSVYDALERLIEKGLVSFIKENEQRFYIPTDPARLGDILDRRRKELGAVLPQLRQKYLERKQKQETLFYRGIEGVKVIFEDQVREGKDVYVLNANREAPEQLRTYFPHYEAGMREKGFRLHLLFAGPVVQKVRHGEARWLPSGFDTPVATNIYGEKVGIIIWGPEPVAILIKNRDIARAYRGYFDLLWGIARPAKGLK
jgi:sugar-specific transcriptional regulator TrmB